MKDQRLYSIFILFVFTILFSRPGVTSEINIESNPEGVEVFAMDPKTGDSVSIGETPFKGSMEEIAGRIGDGSGFVLEARKDGFEPYRLLLTTLGGSNIDLKINLKVSKDIKIVQDLDLLMNDLFDVQRLVRGQDYESAMKKISMLEKKFPHFSIISEIKGSIHYLRKDFTRSLNSYRKAFALNPKNRSAYRMKTYLEKRFNLEDKRAQVKGN